VGLELGLIAVTFCRVATNETVIKEIRINVDNLTIAPIDGLPRKLVNMDFRQLFLTNFERCSMRSNLNSSLVNEGFAVHILIASVVSCMPFYAIFAVAAILVELTLLRPSSLYREYVFSLVVTGMLAFFFCYETAKTWLRGNL